MHKNWAISLLLVVCLQAIAYSQSDEVEWIPVTDIQQKLRLVDRNSFARTSSAVVDELQLSKEQLLKLVALREEVSIFIRDRRGLQERNERIKAESEFSRTCHEKLEKILNQNQLRRLEELALQQRGASALIRPDVRRKLGLTAAQQLRLRDAQSDSIMDAPRDRSNDARMERSKRLGHACYEILTESQRDSWNKMIGEPSASVSQVAPIARAGASEQLQAVNDAPADPAKIRRRALFMPFSGLRNPLVQAELQLTEKQMSQFADSDAKVQEAEREFKSASPASSETLRKYTGSSRAYRLLFDEVLNEVQTKRLGEILFQSQSERAILNREFRESSKLTDEQINSLDKLFRDRQRQFTATAQSTDDETEEQIRAGAMFRRETIRMALEVLTDDQQDVWNRMAGKLLPIEGLLDIPQLPNE